jgi:ribosome-binding factor A
MNPRRIAKAAEAIRETVSTTVLFQLRDPRVKNVTVLSAEVSPDLRSAKIYVTVMGDAKAQSLCMHGLESARGFIQSKIAERLQTKNTPIIKFVLDPSVKKSIEVSRALQAAQAADAAADSDSEAGRGADAEGEDEDHPDEASDAHSAAAETEDTPTTDE